MDGARLGETLYINCIIEKLLVESEQHFRGSISILLFFDSNIFNEASEKRFFQTKIIVSIAILYLETH